MPWARLFPRPGLQLGMLVVMASSASGAVPVTVDRVGNETFLSNGVIQVGISASGSIGTSGGLPPGFAAAAARANLGARQIAPGVGDAILPGGTADGFTVDWIGAGGAVRDYINAERSQLSEVNQALAISTSSGSTTAAATWSGSTPTIGAERLKVSQVVTLVENLGAWQTTVTLTNSGTDALSDVRYLRLMDPDPEAESLLGTTSYETLNRIVSQGGGVVESIIEARAINGGAALGYVCYDGRSRVSRGPTARNSRLTSGCSNDSGRWDNASPADTAEQADQAIALTLRLGDLAPGESATFTYYTFCATDATLATLDIRTFDGGGVVPGPKGDGTSNGGGNRESSGGGGGNGCLSGGLALMLGGMLLGLRRRPG